MAGIHRDTAKIYQFPLSQRRRLDNGLTTPLKAGDIVLSVVDTCWYHDEAIRDDDHKPERPKPC
jgi:hypothetical protein